MNKSAISGGRLCPLPRLSPSWLICGLSTLGTALCLAVPPVVSNITAAQVPGSEKVEIRYDLADPDSPVLGVTLQISSDGGTTWTVPAAPVTGAIGARVPRGTGLLIVWDAGRAWDNQRTEQMRFRITASDVINNAPPPNFALVPAGTFTMGNQNVEEDDQQSLKERAHQVTLDAFYISKLELSRAEWDEVYTWATAHGYDFYDDPVDPMTLLRDHPVRGMGYIDVLKWCNAKTEMEGAGRRPCYSVNGQILRKLNESQTRKIRSTALVCDFSADGYRLPTEAEWEKAARGGQPGRRFPWGNTISFAQANYAGGAFQVGTALYYSYDLGTPRGYHPSYYQTRTAAVQDFGNSANGYGLQQVIGNVSEWCWDIYDLRYYATGPRVNPRGRAPDPNSTFHTEFRVTRGGSYGISCVQQRIADRFPVGGSDYGGGVQDDTGIRLARSL